mmetsp:Transcript_23195/g.39646  ORF Transcript_23195/g.39646 Transcript_23195/m.39646 type:complete len:164 (-) Transcript_23195:669-1160(-)
MMFQLQMNPQNRAAQAKVLTMISESETRRRRLLPASYNELSRDDDPQNKQLPPQPWEELPDCVQRYLARVAPGEQVSIQSLFLKQEGSIFREVSNGAWYNFSSTELIATRAFALSTDIQTSSWSLDFHMEYKYPTYHSELGEKSDLNRAQGALWLTKTALTVL